MFFEVNRGDFRDIRVLDAPREELDSGQVRLIVERFAITTNNITYAVAGDMLDYWGFFPSAQPWGRIPAMGLASVVESAHPRIERGGRYFGFLPMSDEVVIRAEPRRNGFRDAGAHRGDHAAVYTDFRSVAADPVFAAGRDDEYLLLWGMFRTSFLADDHLADDDFRGATQTLVTSASSKTSICLASCLRRRGHRGIGLTSDRNRAFVEGLDLYDEVLTYDEIDRLDPGTASGMVDMAGSGAVRSAVHRHFDDNLRFSLTVGATHWEDQSGGRDLPGPRPEFFFAPSQGAKRAGEWGPEELDRRLGEAFGHLLAGTGRWLTVAHRTGPAGLEAAYRDLLEGRADPAVGYVVSLSREWFEP